MVIRNRLACKLFQATSSSWTLSSECATHLKHGWQSQLVRGGVTMADSFGADRQAGDHQDARHTGGGTNGKRAPIGVGIDCHLLGGWCRGLLAKLLPLLDAPREQSRGDLEGWAGQARERGKRRQLEVRAERPAGAGGRGEWRALERESEQMREAGSGREGARMRSGRRTHAIGKAHRCDREGARMRSGRRTHAMAASGGLYSRRLRAQPT